MNDPLVSIIIPCYNSNATLPRALASVRMQTYRNWECIIIDDGSIHKASEVLGNISDSRIRYIELNENYGRGFARQRGLDEAKGKYLCMVDSDDWVLPNKLESQVKILEMKSDLGLVSCSMAIVDNHQGLIGLRHYTDSKDVEIREPIKGLFPLPIPHAPSMIRIDKAREASYDISLRIVEDYDFLLKLLRNCRFGITREVGYCYAEVSTINWWKIVKSNFATIRILQRYFTTNPLNSFTNSIRTLAKTIIHTLFFILSINHWLIKSRTQPATSNEKKIFDDAKFQIKELTL